MQVMPRFPELVNVVALAGSVPLVPSSPDDGELWTRTPFVA